MTDHTQHPPKVERADRQRPPPSGASPGGCMGMSPSGRLADAPRRRLATALFWVGEVLGALSLFVMLWIGLMAAWVLQ